MVELDNIMAYNNRYMPLSLIKDNMKKCFNCPNEFKPVGPEKGCSIKCKLLGDVRKENGCWFFKNSTSGPYSKIRWKGRWYLAHRCSYEVFKGEIKNGLWVCHTCDKPKCINPDHLFLGTVKENMRDCKNKGRTASGERSHLSRYSDIQVNEMRKLRDEGFTYDRLSRIFGCSYSYLYSVFKKELRIG